MYDLAHFLAPFRGPLGVHAAGGSRQTFIFAYARLNPVCSCAQMLVPRSHDQNALGCQSNIPPLYPYNSLIKVTHMVRTSVVTMTVILEGTSILLPTS